MAFFYLLKKVTFLRILYNIVEYYCWGFCVCFFER